MAGAMRIVVYVQPRARHTAIIGPHREGLKMQVTAPPVDGAANTAVTDLIAATLRVPRRAVRVVQGAGTRRKVVEVDATVAPEQRQQLEELLASR
jgi:uncharacterized protein (TIGR00251 family)